MEKVKNSTWQWVRFIIVFFTILVISLTALILFQATRPFADAERKAETVALKEEYLLSVERMETYNGNDIQYVLYGKKKDEKSAVILDESLVKLKTIQMSKGISRQQAIDTVQKEFPVKKVIHAKLGYEEDHVFWEVVFKGENDTLNYVYLLFEDGKWWKRILNL